MTRLEVRSPPRGALEIAALAGRARAPENAMAARLWLALSESVVPFAAIPYVRQLARLALPRIAMNLDMGYKSQRQANRASLEVEDVAGMWG